MRVAIVFTLLAFLLVSAADPARATSPSKYDHLSLSLLKGQPVHTYEPPYYNAKPWIWVSSSDGEHYDAMDGDDLFFRMEVEWTYTTHAGFHEIHPRVRITGAAFQSQEFALASGTHDVVVENYLPPAIGHEPVALCNEELAERGTDAIEDGFVLVRQNAYEVYGWLDYESPVGKWKKIDATSRSEVYIVCAGSGKPVAGGPSPGKPIPGSGGGDDDAPPPSAPPPKPPRPPTPASRDLAHPFVVSAAAVKIAPQYDGLETTACPVTVPVTLEFQGTEAKSFQYRLTSVNGSATTVYTATLVPHPTGFRATREILVEVPEPGIGAPPKRKKPPKAPGAIKAKGGGGGIVAPVVPLFEQQVPVGLHRNSFRAEVLHPNQLQSAYDGYRITCKAGEALDDAPIGATPKPRTPPSVRPDSLKAPGGPSEPSERGPRPYEPGQRRGPVRPPGR